MSNLMAGMPKTTATPTTYLVLLAGICFFRIMLSYAQARQLICLKLHCHSYLLSLVPSLPDPSNS